MNIKVKTQKNELIDLAKIRDLCEKKSLSISELGRQIGLPERQKINARLKNTNAITGDELYLIADVLGVSTDDLRLV